MKYKFNGLDSRIAGNYPEVILAIRFSKKSIGNNIRKHAKFLLDVAAQDEIDILVDDFPLCLYNVKFVSYSGLYGIPKTIWIDDDLEVTITGENEFRIFIKHLLYDSRKDK